MIQPYPPQYNPQYNPAMPPQYPGLPPGASVNAGMPNPAMAYMQNNTAAPPAPMDYGVNQLLQGLPQQNPYGAGPMANFNSVDQGLGVPQPAFVVPPQGSMYSQQPPMAPGYPQQQYAPQNMQPQPLMMPYPQQQVPPQIQQDPMIPYFGAEAMPPEVPSNESLGAPESGLGAEAKPILLQIWIWMN